MKSQFCCPECKNELSTFENKLHCNKCLQEYVCDGNYAIFDHYFPVNTESKTEIKDLITEIDRSNYEFAVEEFLILNPNFKSLLVYSKFDKSADIIFHGLGRNTSRCLEIKSELGNRSEILSNIFRQVYSIEFNDEYVELQKRRFNRKNCNNVSITKCDLLKLPFPDNFFDMVLCNGVLDNIATFIQTCSSSEAQKKLVLELKRVINDNGCIIFGVKNKHGFKITENSNKKDNEILSKHGFSKYRSILEDSDLSVKPYWVLTSYNRPHYSGSLYDEIATKWLFRNLDILFGTKILTKKIELILSLLKKVNYPFTKIMMKFFSPYFVFYCSKTSHSGSIENWIKKNTKYTSLLRISHRFKNLFILINTKGEAEKVVYIKRHGDDFPNKIDEQKLPDKIDKQKLSDMKEPSKRIWLAKWLNGRPVNSQNENEVLAAIDWLIDLQNNTKQERMNKNDIIAETSVIRKKLESLLLEDINQYNGWLDEYEKYMEKNPFYKTLVHGSFGGGNVLFDPKTRKINVIDWEDLREKGNPCYDFVRFLFYVMTSTSTNPLQRFKECLKDQGDMSKITQQVESKINMHFGFQLDLVLLLRYFLMKIMTTDEEEKITEKL